MKKIINPLLLPSMPILALSSAQATEMRQPQLTARARIAGETSVIEVFERYSSTGRVAFEAAQPRGLLLDEYV